MYACVLSELVWAAQASGTRAEPVRASFDEAYEAVAIQTFEWASPFI